jgi:DNA-binding beta-propeller fold protein YncE
MQSISNLAHRILGACATGAILNACSAGGLQSSFVPRSAAPAIARAEHNHARAKERGGYVYVTNRTSQGASELLVYPAGTQNPAPMRTITKNIADVGGIAVDASGNVYVANGGAGNVLEFAPGAASLVKTYSKDLVHPIDVTVANGTLYVADQGNASNGYAQQILEYALGQDTPLIGIGGLGGPAQLNEGIAVDPQLKNSFFVAATSLTAIPPAGGCPGTYTVAQNLMPTLWLDVPLSQNQQAFGLAFDSNGNLYVSDICANDIAIYSRVNYVWSYTGRVSGTFDAPLFLTINGGVLAIPSAGSTHLGSPGYVTLVHLPQQSAAVTITNALQHPVGAAVGTGS